MDLQFYKYQGTGNDFVMIDDRQNKFDESNHKLIAFLCDRKFGIGADGLILIREHDDYDFEMVYFNADGHEGSMCGNGGRAIVRFAHDLGMIGNETKFIAVDGEHLASVTTNNISLKMMNVTTIEEAKNFYFMDTGSPHYVEFLDEDLNQTDVYNKGKSIRYNERFKEVGTNINFVEKTSATSLYVRTYERGVENETLSCGTGVTACALASSFKGMKSPVSIKTLGGDLSISFEKKNEGFENIFLIGPAQKVFKGKIKIE
jgi:diaminopimelate epimerase